MLVRRANGIYGFRRSVPPALRPAIGRIEFVGSLHTRSPTVARARAGVLYGVVEEVFEAARTGGDVTRHREAFELRLLGYRLGVTHTPSFTAVQPPAEPPIVLEAVSVPHRGAQTFSELAGAFLAGRTDYTTQTRKQAAVTFRLWAETIGDEPPGRYTGKDAGRFLDTLRRLPASHGKARLVPSASQAIAKADRDGNVPRLTEKTVKRHASSLSQLWAHLLPLEHVDRNIWAGFRFPGSKSGRSKRSDWSADDLARLAARPWRSTTISADTYRLVTAISLFSGMRLEEICRLRPAFDIQEVEGRWAFVIQRHPDGWTPKSEAGERVVPIHPALVGAGLVDRARRMVGAGIPRLFPDLRMAGPDAKLGFAFSRQFSRHKAAAGVSGSTTFHSFRHSVSTILRNQDASIRGEWCDAVLGHEGEAKSQGVTVYLKRVGIENLMRTVAAISHPECVSELLSSQNISS